MAGRVTEFVEVRCSATQREAEHLALVLAAVGIGSELAVGREASGFASPRATPTQLANSSTPTRARMRPSKSRPWARRQGASRAYLPPWRTPWFSCSSSVRTPAAISLLPFLDRLPKAVAADPGLLRFGPPEPFSFDGLIERARRLAAQLYVPPPAAVPEVVRRIRLRCAP